jgi:predicted nucleic acid-binding protein
MTRVAIGSNILIYAELEPGSAKGKRSADLILRAARDGVISAQVLGEYLRFVQRRVPAAFDEAIRQAHIYQSVFLIPPTTDGVLNKAAEAARVHRLQLWDCVVCAASVLAGARALLTEDMQDGRTIDGLLLVNPFVPTNSQMIDRLLTG